MIMKKDTENGTVGKVLYFDDVFCWNANLLASRPELINITILQCLRLSYSLPSTNAIHQAAGTIYQD